MAHQAPRSRASIIGSDILAGGGVTPRLPPAASLHLAGRRQGQSWCEDRRRTRHRRAFRRGATVMRLRPTVADRAERTPTRLRRHASRSATEWHARRRLKERRHCRKGGCARDEPARAEDGGFELPRPGVHRSTARRPFPLRFRRFRASREGRWSILEHADVTSVLHGTLHDHGRRRGSLVDRGARRPVRRRPARRPVWRACGPGPGGATGALSSGSGSFAHLRWAAFCCSPCSPARRARSVLRSQRGRRGPARGRWLGLSGLSVAGTLGLRVAGGSE